MNKCEVCGHELTDYGLHKWKNSKKQWGRYEFPECNCLSPSARWTSKLRKLPTATKQSKPKEAVKA